MLLARADEVIEVMKFKFAVSRIDFVHASVALRGPIEFRVPAGAAEDNPHGPQWHFMNHSADMGMVIRPWCVPTPRNGRHAHTRAKVRQLDRGRVGGGHISGRSGSCGYDHGDVVLGDGPEHSALLRPRSGPLL
jgi:hypothetical protein